jgi:hypothetical protein
VDPSEVPACSNVSASETRVHYEPGARQDAQLGLRVIGRDKSARTNFGRRYVGMSAVIKKPTPP